MVDWLWKVRRALAAWRTAKLQKQLSKRQREVAELAASGLSNKEIASRLGIALETVKNHLTAVYRKLGIRGRKELARRGFRRR
jgi:DNA-binding NarL/FixJ family response regulator